MFLNEKIQYDKFLIIQKLINNIKTAILILLGLREMWI